MIAYNSKLDFMKSKKRSYINTLYYALLGLFFGGIYAFIDFYLKLGTENEQAFFPLFLRAGSGSILFFTTIKFTRQLLNKKT
jgi:hypothetical protein